MKGKDSNLKVTLRHLHSNPSHKNLRDATLAPWHQATYSSEHFTRCRRAGNRAICAATKTVLMDSNEKVFGRGLNDPIILGIRRRWHPRVVTAVVALTLILYAVVSLKAKSHSDWLNPADAVPSLNAVLAFPKSQSLVLQEQHVSLEAHVMSKCPDARDCLRDLIVPAMARTADLVNFRLSFIGEHVPSYLII